MSSHSSAEAGPPTGSRWSFSGLEIAAVSWFTVLFVLAIGVANGASNQNTYLLLGLRMADPGFLAGDWLTWEVAHPHRAFGVLVAAFASTGQLIAGLTLGAVVQSAALAVAVYAAMKSVYPAPLIPWAATLAVFASLEATSVASAPFLQPYLEASSLAAVGLTTGLALLAWRRFLLAGVAIGFSGLMHAQFAFLAVPVLAAVSLREVLTRSSEGPARRLAGLWGSFLVVSAPTLYTMARFATAPGADQTAELTAALFPHHVAPWTWPRGPTLVLGAAILLGVGGTMLRSPRRNGRLGYALAAVAAVVVLSLPLGHLNAVEQVIRTWPWRLAPVVLLAGLAAGAVVLDDPTSPRSGASRVEKLGFGLLLMGLLLLARFTPSPAGYALLALCALPAARWMTDLTSRRLIPDGSLPAVVVPALVVTIGFAPAVLQGIERSRLQIRPEDPERAEIYQWIRSETPTDAVFAVPPSWGDFRLNAERPIVVDWKSVPMHPPSLIEWTERIEAVTGIRRPVRSQPVLDSAYATMGCDRVERLREAYEVRFVVHSRPKELTCGQEAYSDSLFRVWEVAPPARE